MAFAAVHHFRLFIPLISIVNKLESLFCFTKPAKFYQQGKQNNGNIRLRYQHSHICTVLLFSQHDYVGLQTLKTKQKTEVGVLNKNVSIRYTKCNKNIVCVRYLTF